MSDEKPDSAAPQTPDPEPGTNRPPPDAAPLDLPKPDGLNVPKITVDTNLKKKGEEDAHPSEVFNKARSHEERQGRKSGCGCVSTLLMILVLAGIALAGTYVWTVKPFVDQGFAQVISPPPVAEAPSSNTLYVGAEVKYEAPTTNAELCIVAGKAELSGEFASKVSFRGGILVVKKGAKFPAGLDVLAAQFVDEGAELPEGQPTGRILSRE